MASGSTGAGLVNPFNTLFRFGVVGDLSDGQLVERCHPTLAGIPARDGPVLLRR